MNFFSKFKARSIMIVAAVMAIAGAVMADELPGFRVVGRHLYDRCGEKVILRGINKMIVWTDIEGESFPEIAKTGANSVRIVWVTTGAVDKFDAAITKCRESNMIPMVELHDATGKWDSLSFCVDWWVKPEVVDVIKKHEEYLLVNIANECGANVSNEDFKAGYTTAVSRMRKAGIRVPIVIDANNWGQGIDVLQATGPDLITSDPDHNIILSVHAWWPDVYGWNDQKIKDEFAESVEKNIPLIVGEFGNTAANCEGEINYKLIIEECQKNEIGWLAWSWGPGNSDCETMDMTTDSKYETLQGWGLEVAVTDKNSIKNTSVIPKFMQTGVCEGSDIKRFSVSVVATGRGKVTMDPVKAMVDSGQEITFTAAADENNEFMSWSGSATGSANPLTLTITENVNLTAKFTDNGPAVGAELVTNGDFKEDSDGWTFSAWGGAEGEISVVDGEAVVEISTIGEFGYNAQLFTTGIDISEGKKYVVSFKARTDNEYELSMNVGLNEDPWTTYSNYQSFSIGENVKEYTFEFESDTTDRKARIVFDVGTVDGKLYLDDISIKPLGGNNIIKKNIRVNKLQKPFTILLNKNGSFRVNVNQKISGTFELININGKCIGKAVSTFTNSGTYNLNFGLKKLPSGTYFVRLANSGIYHKSEMLSVVR